MISTWLTSLSVRNIYWQNYLVSEIHGSMNEGLCEDDYSTALYPAWSSGHFMDLMGTGILRRSEHGSVYKQVSLTKEKQLTQTLTKHTQQPLFRGFPEHLLMTGTEDNREREWCKLWHMIPCFGCAPHPVAMATFLWKHWFLGPRELRMSSVSWV